MAGMKTEQRVGARLDYFGPNGFARLANLSFYDTLLTSSKVEQDNKF